MIGVFITAMMALVLPAEKVIGLALPILIVGDVFAVAAHWKKWDKRLVALLIPGALIGVSIATYFLRTISGDGLRIALAVIVLIFVLYKILEGRLFRDVAYQPKRSHGWLAGIVSGITSTLAHGGGPPVSMYLFVQKLPPEVYVGSAALYFMVLNWIKVPSYLLAGAFDAEMIRSTLWLMPLLPLGVWAGKKLVGQVDRTRFERVIIILLGLSGLFLLIR